MGSAVPESAAPWLDGQQCQMPTCLRHRCKAVNPVPGHEPKDKMQGWEPRDPRWTSPIQDLPLRVVMAGAGTLPGNSRARGGLCPLFPCSPVLQPLLRVLQASFQVPDADLLLLQGRQVLFRRRRLYPMVVTAEVVLGRAPVGTQMSPTRRCRRQHRLSGGAPREMLALGVQGGAPLLRIPKEPCGWERQGGCLGVLCQRPEGGHSSRPRWC